MTDNKISRKLELELKPQYNFFPSSEDRSSARLSTREFQAEFYDGDGERYSCEDNKVWLSFRPPPRIYIISEFNEEESGRLNSRDSLDRLRPGGPFLPQKVSLNNSRPVDIHSRDSYSHSTLSAIAERRNEVWLRWTPKEEHLVVTRGNSTEMKQLIFHLFDFVYFHHGSLTGETDMVAEPKAASGAKPLSFTFNHSDWAITISQNPEYNPKHVGRIQREDGGLFNEEEVKKCIEILGFAFSFIKGARCEPCCLVGYDASGERVWESLSPHPELSTPSPPKYYRDIQLGDMISAFFCK